jgi:hypothetical protein
VDLGRRRITPTKVKVKEKERKHRMEVSNKEKTKANALSLSIPMLPLDPFLPILLGPNLNPASCMRTYRLPKMLWMPLSR